MNQHSAVCCKLWCSNVLICRLILNTVWLKLKTRLKIPLKVTLLCVHCDFTCTPGSFTWSWLLCHSSAKKKNTLCWCLLRMFSFPTKLCTMFHSFASRDGRILYSEELELLHAKLHQVWNTCEAQNKEMIDCLIITNCHFTLGCLKESLSVNL